MTSDAPHLLVLGGGPGGYTAAFLAAERGLRVTMVNEDENPGGVCLYRGCIPSKALLHVARLISESREAGALGVHFDDPRVDLDQLREWKDGVVRKMTGGLAFLGKQRHVEYLRGRGRFEDASALHVTLDGEVRQVEFDHAIIATGSLPLTPGPLRLDSPRVWDSTAALALERIPETLLVIGGGYIGLEMGTVYAALGSRVTVIEMTSGLLPGVDRDLVRPLHDRLQRELVEIHLNTTVRALEEVAEGVKATYSSAEADATEAVFERVLIAVGRRPNATGIGLDELGVAMTERGFIRVDAQRRTSVPNLYAIGDVAGEPMLAHKATHEARTAVEAILGEPSVFEPAAIPAVVFTDPEIAWCGLTEQQARERGLAVDVSRFPWGASGRAATMARTDGVTKLILEPGTQRLLGVGVTGAGAGALIGEAALAVEMGARADDLRLTIHAHPTLSETLMEAADAFFGESPHYQSRDLRRPRAPRV